MKPKTSDWVYAQNGKILEQVEILRKITEQLQSIHSEGNVHGGLTPSHVNPNENPIIKPNASLADESLFEWRPAEETNLTKNSNAESKPTKEGDTFNLGCFFYYIITRGQHPFGGSGQRVSFIANNLYDLSGCRDKQLQKLIAKMIAHDTKKRPTCSELLHHPYLWKSEEIEKYFFGMADNIVDEYRYIVDLKFSNQLRKWNEHFLLPSSQPSSVKSVAEILADIKKKQEAPLDVCNRFPDLLSYVFFTDNPESEIQKEINDEFCPITFQNLLIANASFGELGPFKKRNGRFGLQPVHVMEFSQTSTDISEDTLFLMKRLACLSHPNMLKYFYVGENTEGISCERSIILACEPFNETLEMLSKKKNSLDFETAKDILNQTTAGLLNYHSNNLVHGDITSSQIAIFNNCDNTIAKISKFPVHDKTGSPSMPNDIRRMGHIYRDLFKQVDDVPPLCQHLIQSMIGTRDERVPPCEAVFYHPLFWSPGEIADFLLVVGDFYKDNPTIDRNSKLEPNQNGNLTKEFQDLKTNRSAIEYFLLRSTEAEEEATEALAVTLTTQYPKLLIQTWLKLQKYKSMDCGLDLDPFYCSTYDFPAYNELCDEENLTLQDDAAMCNSTKDQSQGNVCREIAMLSDKEDEGYGEAEFVIDKFSIPSSLERQSNKWSTEVSSGADHPIQCYLSNYVHKWEIAEKDNPGKSMKHPIIDQFGRTAMHLACHSDDFYVLAEKLSHLGSAEPDVRDLNGYAPLHIAAKTNAFRIAQLLIEMKATIDICAKYSITPLFFAVISKSTPTIKLLIKNKADVTKTDNFRRSPLHFAVATNSIENVDLLLKSLKSDSLCKIVNAVDQEGMSALHIAVANQSLPMIEYLLKKYNANPDVGKLDGSESNIQQAEKKRPVVQLAVGMQLYEVVDFLLKAGADPNCPDFHGKTSLHVAALLPPGPNRLAIVDRLIATTKNKEKRANVNAVDEKGRTVLYVATLNNAEDIVQRLLECQPHIEVDKKGSEREITALHLAAWKNFENIVELLIDIGKARVDARDKNGDTPLEYAAASDANDVAKKLLKAGASAKTKRWNGRSALHIAAAHDALQVGPLLISTGADINARDSLDLTPYHYAEFRGRNQFVNLLKDNPLCVADLVSLPLDPINLKSVHNLTNSFKSNSESQIQIKLPTFVAQFRDFNLQVNQELIIDGYQNN